MQNTTKRATRRIEYRKQMKRREQNFWVRVMRYIKLSMAVNQF